MITITPSGTTGASLDGLSYISGRTGISRLILPITRWLRAVNAERYMAPSERLLDIGCGDGYFLKRSKCCERYGLDKRLGDAVRDRLDFPDDYFDYVTMLAVIEHIPNPACLLKEIHRVLKSEGRLVFTTPKQAAERLIRLYVRNIDEEHDSYFDLERVRDLAGTDFDVVGYRTFLCGLNQVFCLTKRAGKRAMRLNDKK